MARKRNDRCPLQDECEKICAYQNHELDCPYYSVNAREDYYIEDQEELRRELERKDLREYEEELLKAYMDCDDEEEPTEEDAGEETEIEVIPERNSLHLDGARGVTEKIKKAMYDAAKQFVYIGFLLWEVQQYGYYLEGGYTNVYEYAEAELNFKRSSTKNFIAIAETFGNKYYGERAQIGGCILPTMNLQPEYEQFNYSQLCEMLAMSPAQREKVTPDMTIKQIRALKKEPEFELEPNYETTPIALPDDPTPEIVGQTSGQEDLKSIVINNIWRDLPPEVIKALVKAADLHYNPKSTYNITIALHKDY